MKIAYLVPGNGGLFYCENCQRDAAMLPALRQAGHEVVSVPLYLPLGPDQTGGTVSPLFFGAVGFYLREAVPLLRSMPAWLRQLADSPAILSLAARQSGVTSARGREDLTLAMLNGDDPVFCSEAEAAAVWLRDHFRPDVVHISNILLIGLVPTLHRVLGVPVVISLQDEHTWLDSCRPDKAAEAWEAIRRQTPGVARYLPVSRYYRDFMADRLGLAADRVTVIGPGIDLAAYPVPDASPRRRVGFLSRWSEAMGLGYLVVAFILLRQRPDFADLGLVVSGGGTASDLPFLRRCGRRLERFGLREAVEFRADFSPAGRRRFLADTTVLSVPSVNGEAYGSFVLEALASGIPVVQPRCGGFDEQGEEGGGGLLVPPGDVAALAQALGELLADPLRRAEMGKTARETVASQRSLAAYARRLGEAYAAACATAAALYPAPAAGARPQTTVANPGAGATE